MVDVNIYRIIDEYLELLAENKFNIIAKDLGIDVIKAQIWRYDKDSPA